MTESVPTPETRRELVSGSRWLTVATVGTGLINYLYALLLTRVLDVEGYEAFAAGQALLLVIGTVSGASIPWVIAKWLAAAGADLRRRREVVWFALLANLVQGLVASTVVAFITLGFAGPTTAGAVGVAAMTLFLGSTVIGWLQGEERFRVIAVFRLGEVVVKVGAGLLLTFAGFGVAGAISGFAIGAGAVLTGGVLLMHHDIRPTRRIGGTGVLMRTATGVVAVQGLVAVFASVDQVLVAMLPIEASAAASYQVAMILARAPLFVAGAIAIVMFPLLNRPHADFSDLVRHSTRMYVSVVGPAVVALAAVPDRLFAGMIPPSYTSVGELLSYTAFTGAAIGFVELLTTVFQAANAYTASVRAQLVGLGLYVLSLLIGFQFGGITGLAAASVLGAVVATAAVTREVRRRWPRALTVPVAPVCWTLALGVVLVALRGFPLLWALVAVPAVAASAMAAMRQRPDDRGHPSERLRILHLGFEDHRRPGSGGGALRTHEVNRRLASRHHVTVLTTSWHGSRDRVEDGVHYVHIGRPWGYVGSVVTYFISLPVATWRRRHDVDLVVEDFAAPISSALAPLWSPRPVLAVVQWLNAAEKSRQYRLPFFIFEKLGLRLQQRYVAVSEGIADRIREANRAAEVWVVPNGVALAQLDEQPESSGDVVFLGRIEFAQKGVDLLIDAFGMVAADVQANLRIAGTGPDEEALRRRVARLGLQRRVELVGGVAGAAKAELLASAAVVAMPSRFETFGIVAVEAEASGTPVVAFDIPCLREVIPPDAGVLVPPFDVRSYADALVRLLTRPDLRADMGRAGRQFSAQFDWDTTARQQEDAYRQALRPAPLDVSP